MGTNYGRIAENIRKELKVYLQTSGLKSLVVGISGGIDSAICVALAKPVCDELNIPIYGRSITIESNTSGERQRANMVGDVFCHNYKEVVLTTEYNIINNALEACEGTIADDTADKIRKGNAKARMRMIYLYNLAQTHRGMVLSTDNYTELMVGFSTLHGDVGDYGMVQNLWKMDVYNLSKWIAENEGGVGSPVYNALMACVEATPTDGLGITNSDLDQLGADTYVEVDAILQIHLRDNRMYNDHPVIIRHYASGFKRSNPFNIPAEKVLAGAVE